ncbi:MAG: phosphate ABC transporter substrate-binding/OmpA family protein [Pseudomonadota bacterium]
MKHAGLTLSAVALLAFSPVAAMADDVTISNSEGSFRVTGEIISFDNSTLTIKTAVGQLTIDRANLICEGDDCPVVDDQFQMKVAVTDESLESLFQGMMSGFAEQKQLVALSVPNANGRIARIGLASDMSEVDTENGAELVLGGPDVGFGQLSQRQVDLVLSAQDVPESALQSIGDRESLEQVVALDAIIPVVNPNNDIRSISIEEIALVAAGRIRNWAELGGPNATIRFILPEAGSSLDTATNELILEPNRARIRRTAERADSVSEAVQAVMNDPFAMTLAGLPDVDSSRVVPIRQSCGPLANATDLSVKAEEYPLTRRVYLYGSEERYAGLEGEFMDYVMSQAAQPLVEAAGYVDQTILSVPFGNQSTRMTSAVLSARSAQDLGLVRAFAEDMVNAERVSTSFRFRSGSSLLDARSIDDIGRMVDFLNSEDARGREIVVVGFTDDVGRLDLNTRLGQQRAQNVTQSLLAAPGGSGLAERVSVVSYGPVAPIGCNDTPVGRETNRRVEIWLR